VAKKNINGKKLANKIIIIDFNRFTIVYFKKSLFFKTMDCLNHNSNFFFGLNNNKISIGGNF
jgi:hypothetical protein